MGKDGAQSPEDRSPGAARAGEDHRHGEAPGMVLREASGILGIKIDSPSSRRVPRAGQVLPPVIPAFAGVRGNRNVITDFDRQILLAKGAARSAGGFLSDLHHAPSVRTIRSRNNQCPFIFTKRSSYSPASAIVVPPSLMVEVINRKLVHRASLPLISGRILVT